LLNEIARLERAVAAAADAPERQALQQALTTRQTHLAIMLEQRSRRRR